jgi:hypothetical protein
LPSGVTTALCAPTGRAAKRVYRTDRITGYTALPAVLLVIGAIINVWGAVWYYTL